MVHITRVIESLNNTKMLVIAHYRGGVSW